MILPKQQVQAILAGAKEARFPADYEHPVSEEAGEVAPVSIAYGKPPTCWVLVKGWRFDDDEDEYVVELARCPAPDTPRLLIAGARAGDGWGYTSSTYLAMRDEPEAIEATLLSSYAKVAAE